MKHLYLIALSALLLIGCGPGPSEKLYPVKGTVTIDGAPLPAGTVTLFRGGDTAGPLISGSIGADGTYSLQTEDKAGAPKGDYQVAVFASIAKDSTSPPEELAPARYNDPTKSGLKITVSESPPAGAYDLQLTK